MSTGWAVGWPDRAGHDEPSEGELVPDSLLVGSIGLAHDQPRDDEEVIDLARRQLTECLAVSVPRPLDEISAHLHRPAVPVESPASSL